ncbi:unnamed protein product [Phaeothamnion confervicola]
MTLAFRLAAAASCVRPGGRVDEDGNACSEYILQVQACKGGSSVVAAFGDRSIRMYARDSLRLQLELNGQAAPLTQLVCSEKDANAVHSSGEDGRVRSWDMRAPSRLPVTEFAAGQKEAWCLALGFDDWLWAVGVGTGVTFFDRRKTATAAAATAAAGGGGDTSSSFAVTGATTRAAASSACTGTVSAPPPTAVGAYADCHTDDVTQLVFRPGAPTQLLTAGEDGIMCLYDTGVADEEEALLCIFNAECPVRRAGFFGGGGSGGGGSGGGCGFSLGGPAIVAGAAEGIWCCTGSEGLNVWHAPSGQRVANYPDVRETGRRWGCPLDYLVGCHYSDDSGSVDGQLRLVAGSFDGQLMVADVLPDGLAPAALLQGSGRHTDQVRDFCWMHDSFGGFGGSGGGGAAVVVTGGEDARLCTWTTAPEAASFGGGGGASRGSNVGEGGSGGAVRTPHRADRQGDNRRKNAFQPYGRP